MSIDNDPHLRREPDSGIENSSRAPEEGPENATIEDVFRILSNHRRRYATLFFLYHDPKPDLRDLARQIAAWENDEAVENVTAEERRRVYSAFQQSHLPKMDDVGLIDYDSTQHTIESTDGISVTQPYLETIPKTSIPWCLYYLAFGGISVGLVTAVAIGALSFSGTFLAAVISVVLAVSAAFHVYYDWDRMENVKMSNRGVQGE